jgi:beta-glucosidase
MSSLPSIKPLRESNFDFASVLPALTLEEKISLLSGCNFNTAAGVARLEIPALKVSF